MGSRVRYFRTVRGNVTARHYLDTSGDFSDFTCCVFIDVRWCHRLSEDTQHHWDNSFAIRHARKTSRKQTDRQLEKAREDERSITHLSGIHSTISNRVRFFSFSDSHLSSSFSLLFCSRMRTTPTTSTEDSPHWLLLIWRFRLMHFSEDGEREQRKQKRMLHLSS